MFARGSLEATQWDLGSSHHGGRMNFNDERMRHGPRGLLVEVGDVFQWSDTADGRFDGAGWTICWSPGQDHARMATCALGASHMCIALMTRCRR